MRRPDDGTREQQAREVERARLLPVAVPMTAAGAAGTMLYAWIAVAFSAPVFIPGFVLCSVGMGASIRGARERLQFISRGGHGEPEPLRHFVWLVGGWAAALCGLAVPLLLT